MDYIQSLKKKKKATSKPRDKKKIDLYPKKTVSVLLNGELLRDLRVFIVNGNNYAHLKYMDIITKKPNPTQIN